MVYKATFNLPNKSPTRQVIEFQEPTAENNYTWYRLYDDGWVEQSGADLIIGNLGNGNASQATAPLLVTMADTTYRATAICRTQSGNDYNRLYASLGPKQTTSCSFGVRNIGGSTSDIRIMWQVCGKSARGATQQNIVCIKY